MVYPYNDYLASKKNKISHKTPYSICRKKVSRIGRAIETEYISGCQGLGWEMENGSLIRIWDFFLRDKNVQELDDCKTL